MPTPGSPMLSATFGFSDKNVVFISCVPHTCDVSQWSHPTHLIVLITSDEGCRLPRSPLCHFITPSILHIRLFLRTLYLYPSLRFRDEVSLPHKTIGKVLFLYKRCVQKFPEMSINQQCIGHVRCLSDLATWPLATQPILFQVGRTLGLIFITGFVIECVVVLSRWVWSR
jgi:hypothetical protein